MNNDFFKSYQTAEWQRLKYRVLERDNYTCQICGEKSGLMQVHHITYKHCGGKAYNAPMGDLITLCEECHRHDDGDHKHFYGGEVILDWSFCGDKPKVTKMRSMYKSLEMQESWYGYDGLLISFRYLGSMFRYIGYRFGHQWEFEYLLGYMGEQDRLVHGVIMRPKYAEEQEPASPDEVERFQNAMLGVVPNLEWFMLSHGGACYIAHDQFKNGIFWKCKNQKRPYPKGINPQFFGTRPRIMVNVKNL